VSTAYANPAAQGIIYQEHPAHPAQITVFNAHPAAIVIFVPMGTLNLTVEHAQTAHQHVHHVPIMYAQGVITDIILSTTFVAL